MAEKPAAKPPTALDWWTTLPGVLTAAAGVITALAGLLVVVPQLRTAAGGDAARPAATVSATAQAPATALAVQPQSAPTASGTVRPAAGAAQQAVDLPVGMEQRFPLEDVVYTVLAARLEPLNAERNSLKLTIRCALGNGSSTSFGSDSFRLLVDGVPRAPVNFLNQIVEARSAKDGDVIFEVPASTATVQLRITSSATGHPYRTGADIPIRLTPG